MHSPDDVRKLIDALKIQANAESHFTSEMALREAAAALSDLLAEREWRPIETAPRDGTRFWGNDGDDAIAMFWHSGFDAFVSSYSTMVLHGGFTFEDGSTERNHHPTVHTPSAWMPLPPPPAEKEPSL